MTDHICTNESMTQSDLPPIALNCVECEKQTEHKVGYGGSRCLECGLYMSDFDDYTCALARLMTKHNIKSKAQIQRMTGIPRQAIYRLRAEFLFYELKRIIEASK